MSFDNLNNFGDRTANDNSPMTLSDATPPHTFDTDYRPESRRAAAFMDASAKIDLLRRSKTEDRIFQPAGQAVLQNQNEFGSKIGFSSQEFNMRLQKLRRGNKSSGGPTGGSGDGTPPEPKRLSVKSEKLDEGPLLAFLLWAISIAAVIWTVLYDTSGNRQLLASVALVWTGLWVGYIGQDRQKGRLGDLGTFTSIVGFVSALIAASLKMNIPLSLADCISVLTLVCLISSLLAGSRIALILSASSALVGVYLHFHGQVSPYAMMAFPAIWATQLYQASKLRSFLATLGTILVGYYWIYGFATQFLQQGIISSLYATTLIFLFGAFQFYAGRAAEDELAPYALLHKFMGWTLASIGAMATQVSWMYPGKVFWPTEFIAPVSPVIPAHFSVWAGIGLVLLVGIFFANLVRWKNARLAMVGVVTITFFCIIVGFTTLFEQNIRLALDSVNQGELSQILSLHHIGFALAAGVFASGFSMANNGIRLRKVTMICVAAVVLSAQAILLVDPAHFNLYDGLIFSILLLLAIAITASLSGRSFKTENTVLTHSQSINA